MKSVPRGQLTCASAASVSSAATCCERAAIASKSPAIIRASISSVTPGIVAPRAPASFARLRATVWLIERVVGAMNTSHAASAPATVGGGSVPSTSRSSMIASTASAPASSRGVPQRLADPPRAGVGDDQHLLARLDREAAVDDRVDRGTEIGHRADHMRQPRRVDSPPRRSSSVG